MKWLTPRFLAIVMSVLTICVLALAIMNDVQRIMLNQRYKQLIEQREELNEWYGEEINHLHDLVEQFERHPKIQEYLK